MLQHANECKEWLNRTDCSRHFLRYIAHGASACSLMGLAQGVGPCWLSADGRPCAFSRAWADEQCASQLLWHMALMALGVDQQSKPAGHVHTDPLRVQPAASSKTASWLASRRQKTA